MKVKILSSKSRMWWYYKLIGSEIYVNYFIDDSIDRYHHPVDKLATINTNDAVITELPESFCVKRCDNKENWKKYIVWLNKTYDTTNLGKFVEYLGYHTSHNVVGSDKPLGTEIHIDDMIKHIDYMETKDSITVKYENGKFIEVKEELLNSPIDEYRKCCKLPNDDGLVYLECITGIQVGKYFRYSSAIGYTSNLYRLRRVEDSEVEKYLPKEEFDLTTNEGRLAYAKKHYPIGCTVIEVSGKKFKSKVKEIHTSVNNSIELQFGAGLLYNNITGEWAEIIKEEINMGTQRLSRQGLKEIHSVACSAWKQTLEHYGSRNPLEDYIELTQEEVNQMFDACTKDQLPIVSKYLKKDDLLDFDKLNGSIQTPDGQQFIGKRVFGKFENKSFYLHNAYDWEIKEDDLGELCLIPTKKK